MAIGVSLSIVVCSYSQFCLRSQSGIQICVALHLYHPFQSLLSWWYLLCILFIFQVGFFSGRKRESIFKSPEDPHGKVGVTGSGKGLTDFQKREKHLHLKGANSEASDEQMLVSIHHQSVHLLAALCLVCSLPICNLMFLPSAEFLLTPPGFTFHFLFIFSCINQVILVPGFIHLL